MPKLTFCWDQNELEQHHSVVILLLLEMHALEAPPISRKYFFYVTRHIMELR